MCAKQELFEVDATFDEASTSKAGTMKTHTCEIHSTRTRFREKCAQWSGVKNPRLGSVCYRIQERLVQIVIRSNKWVLYRSNKPEPMC